MKIALGVVSALVVITSLTSAEAADITAGKAKAEACAACHGRNGVSVSGDIPNLASQKIDYLVNQLNAFRDGTRKNAIMNPIAGALSDADIADLAVFWNSLPGASGSELSELLPEINKTRVRFPQDYQDTFTWYMTINFPDRKQVRKYFANDVAVQAARAGEPMPNGTLFFVEAYKAKLDAGGEPVVGPDGFFVSEKLSFYTAMEMQAGWGDGIPNLYRNGDWNYAVFSTDSQVKQGVNQAKCFACHKPLAEDSYVFSLDALAEKIKE